MTNKAKYGLLLIHAFSTVNWPSSRLFLMLKNQYDKTVKGIDEEYIRAYLHKLNLICENQGML